MRARSRVQASLAALLSSAVVAAGVTSAPGQGDPVDRVAGADRFATAAALAQGVAGETLWVANGGEFADALAAAAAGSGPVLLTEAGEVPGPTAQVAEAFEGEVVAVGGAQMVSDAVVAELGARRVAGADRFETAARIAAHTHPDGAERVYLATGREFPDALAGAPAAAEADAPMLLASGQSLPAATAAAFETLAPSEIVAVGGTAVLDDGVLQDAADAAGGAATERVAGADRYETAVAVAAHRGLEDPERAILATGTGFADALAAAPAAAADGAPLLLSSPDRLAEPTAGALTRLGVDRVTIAGGRAAVTEGVADDLRRQLGYEVAGQKTVTFFDVGQADATLVEAGEAAVLIDTGHWQRDEVVGYLEDAGVDALDVLVLTHWHADHIGQADAVLDVVDVVEVWIQPGSYDSATYERTIAAIEASDAQLRRPSEGEQHTAGPLTLDIVGPGPDADERDVHDASLSVRTSLAGEATVLFTGDAEASAEHRYVADVPDLLDADIYQVGHHGSVTSTTPRFLDAVDPHVAVYSAGQGNPYGHPHAEVLDRLNAAGIDVYGTDVHGTVTATFDGAAWSIDTDTTGTPGPGNGNGEPAPGCVDLNTADAAELTEIIHIGEGRAHAIIDGRPWTSVDELIRIDGIGPSRLDDIKDQALAAVDC